MPVGLLIITHNAIGDDLVATARSMLGDIPLDTICLAVPQRGDPDDLTARARGFCARLDQGDGVLVMSDMYGSTPSNIAGRLLDTPRVQVVSGLNLPMLIRVLNYPQLPLADLVEKAISGGREGILHCEKGC